MGHHYNADLEYLDNLIPFERELYIQMLIAQVEKDNAAKA